MAKLKTELKTAGADPGFFLPTSKKIRTKIRGGGGRVVRYGFGNLFDFDYLIRYLRTSRNKVTTNLGVSLYTSKLMSIVDT